MWARKIKDPTDTYITYGVEKMNAEEVISVHEKSWTSTMPNGRVEHWAEAIYDGRVVDGLYVSDMGRMRRGRFGRVSNGTPTIDKKTHYIKQLEVCIKDPGYKHQHRAVNLHRIVFETFTGVKWIKGHQLDHIDRCVLHGNVDNLRMVTRGENMQNLNLRPPMCQEESSLYRYTQCLKFGVRRIADLPIDSKRKYWRLRNAEYKARKAAKLLALAA